MSFKLENILLLTIASLSFVVWSRISILKKSGQPILEVRQRIQSPIGLVDVALLFCCWIFGQVLGSGLVGLFVAAPVEGVEPDPAVTTQLMFVLGATQLVATMAGLVLIGIRHGYAPRIFGWQPEHLIADLKLGVLAFLAIIPIVWCVQILVSILVPYEHGTLNLLKKDSGPLVFFAAWFSAVFVAPITEEVFFRGALLPWLQRQNFRSDVDDSKVVLGGWTEHDSKEKSLTPFVSRGQKQALEKGQMPSKGLVKYQPQMVVSDDQSSDKLGWAPILISSLLFGLIHLGQGAAPVPLFVLAVGIAYVYRQTGSIVPCIVVHLLLNATTMLIVTLNSIFGS